jgi:hypothetical protein
MVRYPSESRSSGITTDLITATLGAHVKAISTGKRPHGGSRDL